MLIQEDMCDLDPTGERLHSLKIKRLLPLSPPPKTFYMLPLFPDRAQGILQTCE